MCGRFTLFFEPNHFLEEFSLLDFPFFPPFYNIAPSQNIPIITYNSESLANQMTIAHWGLIPSWAKDLKKVAKPINARAETLQEKPYFRKIFASKRCLIPANGFYEWDKRTKPSTPIRFCFENDRLFAFAGLWSQWHDPQSDVLLQSCTIITCAANQLVKPVHQRMPVVLTKPQYNDWLNPKCQQDTLQSILEPKDFPDLMSYPVSNYVNSPSHNDKKCIQPV